MKFCSTLMILAMALTLAALLGLAQAAPASADDGRFLGTENMGGTTVILFVCKGTPPTFQISATDKWGNESRPISAHFGKSYHMVLTQSGNVLEPGGMATSPKEVEIRNDLMRDAIDAHFYINGQKVATSSSIPPGQKAKFWIKCQKETQ